jgi:hypothetical protein
VSITRKEQASANDPDKLLAAFDDAEFEFDAKVREAMQRTPGLGRDRAIISVARRNKRLYRAYMFATNPGRQQTRMLQEKFEAEDNENRRR